ncbi:MAG: zinc-binding dehydrogenase [Archangium sp.]|nr:zinc-binding dehydrogenase [Archangium sp.]MDP3157394.1 zinc-binding dehydrogenase [Archangium sp.]MDP3571232.1 zinc-binding dehydrogenase [Archangium sp.]
MASKPGGPEVLEIVETAEPEVRDGEVKIRVHAFGLNKAESYYRAGNYGIFSPELALGYEAVGEIVEDPSGRMARGQRVATAMGGMMTQRHGGYAEFITVNASNAIPIDSGLEWTELAALPEAYLTVWGALEKSLRIAKGQWLLVRGATSSLGLAAVAYAKMRDLTVIATSRRADHVVVDAGQIGDSVLSLRPGGVDHAIEVIGAATLLDTARCVRSWGEVVVVGLLGGPPILNNFNLMMDIPNTVKLSFFNSQMLGSDALPLRDAPLSEIANGIAGGGVPSSLAKVFPVEHIKEAHHLLDGGTAGGKIVVTR